MPHRLRISLLLAACVPGLAACGASAPRSGMPASPVAPAQSAPPAEQTAAPPAGQAAPIPADENLGAPASSPDSMGGQGGTTRKNKAAKTSPLAEAQAELARANRELVALYAPSGGKQAEPGTATATGSTVRMQNKHPSRCNTACKAFASLERAADAVCRLAGDDDARCDHAKKLVDENRRRVASCGCQQEKK